MLKAISVGKCSPNEKENQIMVAKHDYDFKWDYLAVYL